MGPVRQNPIQRTVSLFMCVCIALCTIVAHNIAQNRPDSFRPYPPDDHHCSDDVYLREGGDMQCTQQWICSKFSWKMPQHLKCLATVIYDLPLITIPVSNCHLFSDINISQGSVATHLRCGGTFSYHFTANLSLSRTVKEFWKSVKIWQSYCYESGCPVFFGTLMLITILCTPPADYR